MFLDYNGGMMWGSNDGGSWFWMAAMMVVVLGVIVGLVVFAIRATTGPKSNDQAADILRRCSPVARSPKRSSRRLARRCRVSGHPDA